MLLGWIVGQIINNTTIKVPDLTYSLRFLGTLGLILIVLDGTLEIELNRSKIPVIKKSIISSVLQILLLAFLLATAFRYFLPQTSYTDALTNAIPLCVISSAIAIPSVKHLSKSNREFITYESSLSDIFGVVFFNFVALNALSQSHTAGESLLQLLIMIAVSFAATVMLAFLLSKIDHHIKFIPIILLILLIYSIARLYHLPALIFILIFGLFLGNLDELKTFKWTNSFKVDELNKEVHQFKSLNAEATFLVRALFFLLFGFLIETREVLNTVTLPWAIAIIVIILVLRIIQFKLFRTEIYPLVFIAPRGLINIQLFLSIVPAQHIPLVNKSLLIQVVLLSSLVLMIGLMLTRKKADPLPV